MSRVAIGAALGAAGTTACLRPDVVASIAFPGPPRASGTSGREVDHLYELVERLSRDVQAASRQGVTIVQGGADRSTGAAFYLVTIAGLGTVAYFTVVRGWRLGDLLYATRRGLREGLQSVTQGLEALGGRVTEVKTKLAARIAELSRKQDLSMAGQDALRDQLAGVGGDVETTRGQVGQIHGLVLDMEASLTEVGANQRHANHGILLLCKAVSELMQGSNTALASQAELLEFTQHPIWQGERVHGLEGVLLGSSTGAAGAPGDEVSSGRRSPFLLAGASPTSLRSGGPTVAAMRSAQGRGFGGQVTSSHSVSYAVSAW